jgi:NTP pyrophosphatase (non-canonical NTP hydrolase)
MPDTTTTLATLKEAVRRFAAEREWEPFHSPKNLVMGLSVEAAELMEHFLWIDNEASRQVVHDPARLGQIADEMADVACYLLNLSLTLGIDLSDAITAKIAKNAVKYPVEKCRGHYTVKDRSQGSGVRNQESDTLDS